VASQSFSRALRPREFPEDVPFIFDAQSIFASEMLTLTTDASKRAAGREKDRAGLIELQALKEARDTQQ
jgi:hypothetical protein